MKPKVLVGCPTSFHKEYCLDKYVKGVKRLTYKNFDFLLVDNSEDDVYFNKLKKTGLNVIKGPWFDGAMDRIIESRNMLRQKVLDEGYDYFFSLEQDVITPPDVIERMIGHKKKLVTGVYFANNSMPDGSIALIPLVYKLVDKANLSMAPINEQEFESNKFIEVVSAGLGCVMIHRDILKDIKFRYENKVFDDRFFFKDCYDKKFKVFCDTSIKCKHYILNRPYPWSKIKK
ncbi:MAG: hypothetical protein KKA79_09260 [Nanoarchaeota archaeon]|nr:hypothetical protein [Nanoarchaeota archaeon]MCG2718547.1 hypothetical protein [Nanoarchaeota archaeon]